MNKLLSALLVGIFAATLGASAFAAEPASAKDSAKALTTNAAPMKHKHAHKSHKSNKAEKISAAPEASKAAPEVAK